MIRYPRVLIVDRLSSDAKVLYDFQDDTQIGSKTGLHADSWDFGDLDLLGEPDAVGVDWGVRTLTFTQEISGTKSAALARQSALSKAMLRRRFWLEFQLTAETAPVWWYAYRTPPGNLSLDSVYNEDGDSLRDRWEIAGTIKVDPFAYLPNVKLEDVVVGNDPANEPGTPATGINLPAIKGDAPARLRMDIAPGLAASSTTSQRWIVATVSSDRENAILRSPIGGSGDGITAFTGTSGSVDVADAVGGKARTVSFSTTSTMAARLSAEVPVMGSPGATRYLVLLRCAAVDGTSTVTMTFQLGSYFVNGPALTPAVTAVLGQAGATKNYQLVPLGVVGIGDGLPVGAIAPTKRSMRLSMASSSSSAVATLDEFIFIPIAGDGISQTSVLFPTLGTFAAGSGNALLVDGDDEIAWLDQVGDGLYTSSCTGGFPTVDPAADYNALFVAPVLDTRSSPMTALAATTIVAVAYYPRSSWIGDGTA